MFFLIGCNKSSEVSAGKIIPPTVKSYPLDGKWIVAQEWNIKDDGWETNQSWVDDVVQFDGSIAAFAGNVWEDLSYKIKRVNMSDYLMTKYSAYDHVQDSNNEKVEVITIYAASGYLAEGMKIDEKSMIFFVQNKELLLEKINDQADRSFHTLRGETKGLKQGIKKEPSGILLGLRTPLNDTFAYRTLWISKDEEELRPILMADQIFFPRTSGFWELIVEDFYASEKKGQKITANHVVSESLEMKASEEGVEKQPVADPATQMIHYIGNDYVSIEKEIAGVKQLQIIPVDKFTSAKVMTIRDLLGEEGLSVFLSLREQEVLDLRNNGATWVDRDEEGRNIGLVRENGRWYLVGRINYHEAEGVMQKDFYLKTLPPANLIFYDSLGLSWLNIKDRVPDAEDAFTSPNKDLMLVKTKNKLVIYSMIENQLAKSPIAEIELIEGSTVVMAEWATASYVKNWEESFRSYGAWALTDNVIRY